jgi:hypothetical protein
MKRVIALVALLTALGVLSKLALKPRARSPEADRGHSAANEPVTDLAVAPVDPLAALGDKYAGCAAAERDLVARVGERFRQTAVAVERTDGLRGLRLLDRLDLEAVFLYDKHPKEFRRLRDMLDDDAAAEILLHGREYFGLKRADETDRSLLVAELAQLRPGERKLAARYPSALPLILADPSGMAELAQVFDRDPAGLGEALAILGMISLENGTSELRTGLRTIENHGRLALDAFRQSGPEGFALVSLYGQVIEALGASLPLDQTLVVLRVNSEYIDELLLTHRPETVAGHISRVAVKGLVQQAGGSPQALRLAVEFGERGERALAKAGPDAADVVFGNFADPTLRNQAVAALGVHGSMALVILDKYASDPDFREILRSLGAAIIPPIAQADTGPEALALLQSKENRSFGEVMAKLALLASGDNGQAVIRIIRKDGLERVASLNSSKVEFTQFLPLYDVLHLGNVLRHGYSPTSGEMTWATIDGCFVVADVLSLSALQPEGAAAAEAARSEVKAAAREGAKAVGRELIEAGSETASRRLARWWTVRAAGGVFQVLHRLPEALPRMTMAQVVEMARPICTKAGMKLSTWNPIQLLRAGAMVPFRIPPERGLKYVAAQIVQASVGVVGFQKMEEHMAARRPRRS